MQLALCVRGVTLIYCICSMWVHKRGINDDCRVQNIHRARVSLFLGNVYMLYPMGY